MPAFTPRRLPFFLLICAITYLSIAPAPEMPGPTLSDKVLHIIAYAGIAFWGYFGFPKGGIKLALFIVSWSIFIEFMQWLTPTRMLEVLDMVANTIGVFVGWGSYTLAAAIKRRFIQK